MIIRKFAALLLAVFCLAGTAHAEDVVYGFDIWGHNFPPVPAPMVEYDQWGNISKQHVQYSYGFREQYIEYTYDETGRLLKEYQYNDGYVYTEEYVYDENGICVGRVITHNDGTTTEYTYEYDVQGNLLRSVKSDGSVVEYTNEYDGQGRILSAMGSDGKGSTYEYREDGSYKVVHSNGAVEEYGSDGILDSAETSDGFFSTYDEKGRRIKETFPEIDQEKTWTYSDEGKLVQYCANLQGNVSVYDYDEEGYLLKVSEDSGDADMPDEVWEYSRTGALIRRSGESEWGPWFSEFREDGKHTRGEGYDEYGKYTSMYREDGYLFKRVYEDGSCWIYRHDENNLDMGWERHEADGGFYAYSGIPDDGSTEYGIIIDQPGRAFKMFFQKPEDEENYDMNSVTPIYYIMYEYDDGGHVLSYEYLSPEEYRELTDSD